jgi:hypothetical protein
LIFTFFTFFIAVSNTFLVFLNQQPGYSTAAAQEWMKSSARPWPEAPQLWQDWAHLMMMKNGLQSLLDPGPSE